MLSQVWNLDYPVKLKFEADMKQCNFQHTHFSQFNNSDSLLLVSGPKTGALSTDCLGFIIVFSLEGEKNQLSSLIIKGDTYYLRHQLFAV